MSFFVEGRPTITAMLYARNTADALLEVEKVLQEGTDAFCLLWEGFPKEERTEENLRKLFAAMNGKPVYITNYHRGNTDQEETDEELAEELLMSLKCGAALIDIRGDMFDRQEEEITFDEVAVEKQKALIRQIKELGGEVLMSSHVLKYASSDRVMEIAMAQKERGTDLVKIVTAANSEEELVDNFAISARLKNELGQKFLFLCGGSHCRRHRLFGPLVGSDIFLTRQADGAKTIQPYIHEAKTVMELAGFTDLP